MAAAEMCIGGRLGADLSCASHDALTSLFGEVNGCLLVEVRPADSAQFEALFGGLPIGRIGLVTATPTLTITHAGRPGVSIAVPSLVSAWKRMPVEEGKGE